MKKIITINNLSEHTEQEVFDFVAGHLRGQGMQSIFAASCAYRGGYGVMCAAGCLIPDSMYHPDMEGRIWESISEILGGLEHCSLIESLQICHDLDYRFDFEHGLKKVADKHNLKYRRPEDYEWLNELNLALI